MLSFIVLDEILEFEILKSLRMQFGGKFEQVMVFISGISLGLEVFLLSDELKFGLGHWLLFEIVRRI